MPFLQATAGCQALDSALTIIVTTATICLTSIGIGAACCVPRFGSNCIGHSPPVAN